MTPPLEHEITSFVVRFIKEMDGDTARWRGKIRHVQSEQEISFAHFTDAVTFIRRQLSVGEDDAHITLAKLWRGMPQV